MSPIFDADFDLYWAQTMAELMSRPPAPEVDDSPIRSTDFSRGLDVRLTSLGNYRLFAFYSVPAITGPHAAVYHTPGYASVVNLTPYEERRTRATLALCARGQRLSDRPYAANFPGLLTDSIERPETYPFRGIVADACRGVDFLKGRREIESRRISVVGSDTALMVAALRPEVRAAVVADPIFASLSRVSRTTTAYPYEEINDYRRANSSSVAQMETTLEYFEPLRFASRIRADVLITCGSDAAPFNRPIAEALASAIGPRAEVYQRTGRGYLDRVFVERWLAEHGG